MEPENLLGEVTRAEFRRWLEDNHGSERECWVQARRGRPCDDSCLWYLDAVEEAICFGWIDSVRKPIDGVMMQRFSPRRKSGNWSELNKERARRLERLGLMTDAGRAALPPEASFTFDPDMVRRLQDAGVWERFLEFPELYQRVRAYGLSFIKKDADAYERMLDRLVRCAREGRTFGEWNDYGRLLRPPALII